MRKNTFPFLSLPMWLDKINNDATPTDAGDFLSFTGPSIEIFLLSLWISASSLVMGSIILFFRLGLERLASGFGPPPPPQRVLWHRSRLDFLRIRFGPPPPRPLLEMPEAARPTLPGGGGRN